MVKMWLTACDPFRKQPALFIVSASSLRRRSSRPIIEANVVLQNPASAGKIFFFRGVGDFAD